MGHRAFFGAFRAAHFGRSLNGIVDAFNFEPNRWARARLDFVGSEQAAYVLVSRAKGDHAVGKALEFPVEHSFVELLGAGEVGYIPLDVANLMFRHSEFIVPRGMGRI